MMVSPKSVGDVADAADENNRDCGSDGGCTFIIIPILVEARPESIPVRLLLFVLTHRRRWVREAHCLKQLPTDEVDGRFDRTESRGADILVESAVLRGRPGVCALCLHAHVFGSGSLHPGDRVSRPLLKTARRFLF